MRWIRRPCIVVMVIASFEFCSIRTSAFTLQHPARRDTHSQRISHRTWTSQSLFKGFIPQSALYSTSSKKPDTPSSLFRDLTDFWKQIVPSFTVNQADRPQLKAWQCHGDSQKSLVRNLKEANIIKTVEVQKVMEAVDRRFFVSEEPLEDTDMAYWDRPLSIAHGQSISAPHMHAHVLEHILPAIQQNARRGGPVKILDIGCGSGYVTACFGRWFHAKANRFGQPQKSILPFEGKVYGMDIHEDLCEFTKANIQKNNGDLLDSGTISIDFGNGWLGWPEEAPFDAIHVGAAAAVFPKELAMQLALRGVLLVPVGDKDSVQTLMKVKRTKGPDQRDRGYFCWEDYEITKLLGVRYVPLVEQPKQDSHE